MEQNASAVQLQRLVEVLATLLGKLQNNGQCSAGVICWGGGLQMLGIDTKDWGDMGGRAMAQWQIPPALYTLIPPKQPTSQSRETVTEPKECSGSQK